MSNTNVSLDVRNFPSNGSDGYTDTTASNHAVYSYLYSGGSDGHGNVEEIADSNSGTITVGMQSDPRYRIDNVVFSGDVESQLSWQPGSSPTSVVITDSDTETGRGTYCISVTDTSANCTFPCDPEIVNKPKVNTGR